MPKPAKSLSNKLNYFAKHYGTNILGTDNKIKLCRVVKPTEPINASKRFHHISSNVHFFNHFYFITLLSIFAYIYTRILI